MMATARGTETMTIGALLGAAAGAHRDIEVSDLVSDSRDVSAGAAFIALRGRTRHGLEFAAAALERGAAIVLYDPDDDPHNSVVPAPSLAVSDLGRRLGELGAKFYSSRKPASLITGVTGTNGKTTVAYLLSQALTTLGRPCGYVGTLGFGIPPQLGAQRLTTPDCLTLHREVAAMPGADVVIEVSSHALAQNRIDGLPIRVAVFTNLTRDHLDEHGDFADYAHAKAMLFRRPGLERAVLNFDDRFSAELVRLIDSNVRVLGVSSADRARAELRVAAVRRGADGMTLAVTGDFGAARMSTRLIGGFNAENLGLALGAMLSLDVPLKDACRALERCSAPPGRMEVFGGGEDAPTVIVDYAHTPDALARALDALAELGCNELWCVVGCGGDRDPGKRPLMGRAAGARADHVVLTDDNPRSEDPESIVAAIRLGIEADVDVVVEHDRRVAILYAIDAASVGDIVLVAGKGHESVQSFGDHDVPFDDRQVVADALRRRA
jgi:UDP-N-acetylmuramoyl-L-alanyl-D-glutamate--2,6-diaminopimelate ligase